VGNTPRHKRTLRDQRRRDLSQNFLVGKGIRRFVDSLDIPPGSTVVEVGAGSGNITAQLASRYEEVVAYEVDPDFVERLRNTVTGCSNVTVLERDFFAAEPPARPFYLVGNPPFSRTADLVRWTLEARTLRTAFVITQREYARKRTGGGGRWSLLTVKTWPFWDWSLKAMLPRTLFRPVPSVDAAILMIEQRSPALLDAREARHYSSMIELAFTGLGGTAYASLTRRFSAQDVRRAFSGAGVDTGTVVAFVHPDQWLAIHKSLRSARGSRRTGR
jgi:23S rRNA (adenine-N6)-dimethyltransferase